MADYGMPYQGSKDKIAPALFRVLPSGKRFVDLFGGGAAMTHAALLSNKYEKVLYNELKPILVDVIDKAISGVFNNFKPIFITREKFHAYKEQSGYIKYIWSFSTGGKEYLFGKEIESDKKMIHDFVVFGVKSPKFKLMFYDVDKFINPKEKNWHKRRMLWRKYAQLKGARLKDLERLEQLERLECMQQLNQLERYKPQLTIKCGDYRDYEYQEGDIVYLDPPYEDTASYSDKAFNHKEFYDWCASRPYQVYFSSFNNISDKRFRMIWASEKRNLMGGATNTYNYECLYTNK